MAGLSFTSQLQTVPRNAWLYFAPMAASRLWRQPVGRTPQQISPELFFNTQVPIGVDFSGQYIPSEAIPIPDQSPDPLTVLPPEAQPVPGVSINPILLGLGLGGLAGTGIGCLANGTDGILPGSMIGAGIGGAVSPYLLRKWKEQYPLKEEIDE